MSKLEETIAGLKYDADGLIPAVCVEAHSRQVLMVAYMDAEALRKTIETSKTHFYSRSRQKHWMKGESSGHTQDLKAIYVDCDDDTLIIEVHQHGAACHTGYYSCFFRKLTDDGRWQIIAKKVFEPREVYKKD